MGIDASTKCTGYSIFKDKELISYGKIPSLEDDNWRLRVTYMVDELEKLINQYHVNTVVVETPIKTIKNVNTLQLLFTLNGAILGMTHIKGINFIPIEVNGWRKKLGLLKDIPRDAKDKKAILKERSVKMANDIYGLNLIWKSPSSKFNDDDISDAILLVNSVT